MAGVPYAVGGGGTWVLLSTHVPLTDVRAEAPICAGHGGVEVVYGFEVLQSLYPMPFGDTPLAVGRIPAWIADHKRKRPQQRSNSEPQ